MLFTHIKGEYETSSLGSLVGAASSRETVGAGVATTAFGVGIACSGVSAPGVSGAGSSVGDGAGVGACVAGDWASLTTTSDSRVGMTVSVTLELQATARKTAKNMTAKISPFTVPSFPRQSTSTRPPESAASAGPRPPTADSTWSRCTSPPCCLPWPHPPIGKE